LLSLNRELGEFSRVSCRTGIDYLTLRRCINVHLLSLLDGAPHEVPRQKVLKLDLEYSRFDGSRYQIIDKRISECRIAIAVEYSNLRTGRYIKVLIVWDWRTGKAVSKFLSWETPFDLTPIQVLEHSSDDPGIGNAISDITSMCLEGSWLLVASHPRPVPLLLVFDTQLPQQDPRSWLILDLPQVPAHGRHSILTRRENPFAECPEFLVDPAQRVFALFTTRSRVPIVPVELLIRCANSVRTSSHIPWKEWAEDVIMLYPGSNSVALQIFDTKVLVLRRLTDPMYMYGVDVYDLGRCGQKVIQMQNIGRGVDGKCSRVPPAPKWLIPCHMGDGIHGSMTLLGSVACFMVSPTMRPKAVLSYSILHRAGAIALHWRGFGKHLEIGPDKNRGERLELRPSMRQACCFGRIEMSHLQAPRLWRFA